MRKSKELLGAARKGTLGNSQDLPGIPRKFQEISGTPRNFEELQETQMNSTNSEIPINKRLHTFWIVKKRMNPDCNEQKGILRIAIF